MDDHLNLTDHELPEEQWNLLSFLHATKKNRDRQPFDCYLDMNIVPWGKELKTGVLVDMSSEGVDSLVRQARALQMQSPPKPISEVIKDYDRLFIVGDVGWGKTSTLKYLTWKISTDKSSKRSSLIPIYFYLGEYTQKDGLDKLINRAIKASRWQVLGQEYQIQFLIDGFDEIPHVDKQHAIDELATLIRSNPQHRYVIATSKEEYDEGLPLKSFHLSPLTEDEIEKFVTRYFTWLGNHHAGNDLMAILRARVKLQPLSRVPLLLTMLIGIYYVSNEIPLDESSIIYTFVKSVVPKMAQTYEQFLARLAFEMTNKHKYWMTSLEQQTLHTDDHMSRDDTLSPCLAQDNEGIRFIHRSIQDFFAAKYIQEEGFPISTLADEKPRMEGMVNFYRLIMGNFGEPSERQVLFARSFTKWHQPLVFLSRIIEDAGPIIDMALDKQDLKLASDCFLEARFINPITEQRYVQALRTKIHDFSELWEDVIGTMRDSGLSWEEMNYQRNQMRSSSNEGIIQLVSLLQDVALKSRDARLAMAEIFLNMEVQGDARCVLCKALMSQLWKSKDKEMLEMFREPLLNSDPCCEEVRSDVELAKNHIQNIK